LKAKKKKKKWFQILEVVETIFSEMRCAHCKGSIKVEKDTPFTVPPLRTSSPHQTHTHPRDALQKERVYKLVHTHSRNGAAKGEIKRGRGRQRGNSETASRGRERGGGEEKGKGKRNFIHPHKSKWVPPHPRSRV